MMLELADKLDSLPIQNQRAFALCVVERMLVARSLIVQDAGSSSFDGLLTIIDELWNLLSIEEELGLADQERMRRDINSLRSPKEAKGSTLSQRDICWILKSVLNVFRQRDHAYEIARLGAEMVTRSKLDTDCEVQNQQTILEMLSRTSTINAEMVTHLRDQIRALPLMIGEPLPEERD